MQLFLNLMLWFLIIFYFSSILLHKFTSFSLPCNQSHLLIIIRTTQPLANKQNRIILNRNTMLLRHSNEIAGTKLGVMPFEQILALRE